MIKVDSLINLLKKNNSDFYTGVPDSVLKELSCVLQNKGKKNCKGLTCRRRGNADLIGFHCMLGGVCI